MRDVFAHTSAWWGKYSDYVWKTAPDGHCYLHPAQNAKPGVYDPMKDSRSIVLDALEIGLMQFRHAGESELKAAIHSFAEKYGLLGIMTALPTTARFFDYEKVYLPKNEFLREESMDTMDYIRLFFPFAMPDFQKEGLEYIWESRDKDEIAMLLTFQNQPNAMSMTFLRNYGERYDWLCKVFKDWAFLMVTTTFYMKDKDKLAPETLEIYRRAMISFDGNVPSYHVALWDEPTLVWDFHSLMANIRFMLSLMLTDEDAPLRLCGHCMKPFFADESGSEYCSEECREQDKT